eukprot:scaffold37752_cov15-Tisochrysis_lutea.AAC.1
MGNSPGGHMHWACPQAACGHGLARKGRQRASNAEGGLSKQDLQIGQICAFPISELNARRQALLAIAFGQASSQSRTCRLFKFAPLLCFNQSRGIRHCSSMLLGRQAFKAGPAD